MSPGSDSSIELLNPAYVPIITATSTSYGGSQMWFTSKNWFSKEYLIHNYGCHTIAASDLLLYLSLRSRSLRSPITDLALQGSDTIYDDNYKMYVHEIYQKYTKTLRYFPIPGPKLALAINTYADTFHIGYKAYWKWTLSYYDMYERMDEMLFYDIPIILSIGPNTPNLWGKKGITFYQRYEVSSQSPPKDPASQEKQYRYQPVIGGVHGHYITVTGMIKDPIARNIMLRISSWGKQYYMNYEEYREYIEETGGTFTSSIVYIRTE